tara:strand:+ start:6017 stop:6364 length:348 start_codon:yes stop_codon:yes gene_type:complete
MHESVVQRFLKDFILTFVFVGVVHYSASIYHENPKYLRLTAFIWGSPLLYFYLIYIVSKKDLVKDFTQVALAGTSLTLFSFILTLMMYNYLSVNQMILMNFLILLSGIITYIYFM